MAMLDDSCPKISSEIPLLLAEQDKIATELDGIIGELKNKLAPILCNRPETDTNASDASASLSPLGLALSKQNARICAQITKITNIINQLAI